MTSLDYTILIVYLLAMTLTGSLFFRRQRSLREFLLAGRSIPWWAAAFSGVATIVSAISYLGAPGQAVRSDLTFLQYRLTTPVAIAVVCLVFIPFFHRLDLFTAYEYLERRFDLKTRLLASSLFLLFKCAFLGIAIYAPSLVVSEMTQLPLAAIIVGVGAVTTLYTVLGGMRAVIWTDSLQLVVLLGGLAITGYIVLQRVDGGLETIVSVARVEQKLRFFDLSTSFARELTLWGSLAGGTFLLLSQYGVDQAELQRFLTTRSVRTSQAAIASAMIFAAIVGACLFFIGIGLYVFYLQFPEKGGLLVAPDRVFPKFIIEELPPGMKGLVIAGVFAAGMSTISSILHSLTTVALTDFYKRLGGEHPSVMLARGLTIGGGILCTGIALFADRMGNLLVASTTVNNLFGGTLVGVFLLGMLTRSANGSGTCLGGAVGFTAVILLASFTPVSWMWYGAFAVTMTMTSGLLFSRFFDPPRPEALAFVYRPAAAWRAPIAELAWREPER